MSDWMDDKIDLQRIETSEFKKGYNKAIDDIRKYLKTVEPCEMSQEIWNIGVDNTCDRMLKK